MAVPLEQAGLGDCRHTIDFAKEAQGSRLGIVPGVDLGAAVVTEDRHPKIVAVPGIRRPGSIELKCQPAVEPDERRGEIFDFIWFAGYDLETPPLPLTSSFWTQRRVGRRAHPTRGRIAKDPQG